MTVVGAPPWVMVCELDVNEEVVLSLPAPAMSMPSVVRLGGSYCDQGGSRFGGEGSLLAVLFGLASRQNDASQATCAILTKKKILAVGSWRREVIG